MLRPVRVVAPEKPLVDVLAARRQCNLDCGDQDELLEFLIAAGTAHIDGYDGILGRAFVNQTWRQDMACWPQSQWRFPLAPVSNIVEIKYYDETNTEQPLAASNYHLLADAISPYLQWASQASLPAHYDRPNAVAITYVAGYGEPTQVPAAIRHGLLLWVATMFAQRETIVVGQTVAAVPSADALLRQFCRVGMVS